MEEQLDRYVESLIFAANEPIRPSQIQKTLELVTGNTVDITNIESSITRLVERFADSSYSFEIAHIDGGYQFLSKGAYHHILQEFLKLENRKRLSKTALETLSIIAYKQPVTKPEIEHIRGVNCDYTIQKLLDKDLIEIQGRSEGPGKPLLYGTSAKFMSYFGLGSVTDLPKLKDVEGVDNQVGEPIPTEESTD